MLTVVAEDGQRREDVSLLDDIVPEGARRMLAAALEAEVDAYLAELAHKRDERDRRLVVRNGHAQPRQVMTSAGAIEVVAPRVNDKRVELATGQRKRFRSAILPPWCRKSPKIAEVLPLLYLHGLSSGDFVPALEQFLGSAAGLSAAAITRLTAQWTEDYRTWRQRDLSQVDYVYVWADGIHVNVRLEEDKLCLLVIVGVRADGSKELVALADGYRESAGSWADLLRDCARRSMSVPILAVGDGALGFWAALREVFPDTREQRDWVHKTANVLAALPKSAHPGAKAALAEIWGAEDKRHAQAAAKRFADLYGTKFAKAAAKVTDDLDVLLTFYDYPAEHWVHLRTSNPIESTFATVRHRTRVTKGPGSRAAGLAMAFKLIEAAQDRWRAVNAPHLVALVRAGAVFVNGHLVERPAEQAAA
ncbi:IS256 family transposase [Dactylosporangium matsuzakiense]|uniref:Mutator family transposase n=1 Tax=Dactylosporangium matsuzakiense TaxID=53360 RepID=A0A9W6KXF8_9ACTN|nr:IS256 family transposase [Dactylosporangium matsuzakiense]GLL07239.1 IS256 family transposase [Dactylosporangium matsuzakiense]